MSGQETGSCPYASACPMYAEAASTVSIWRQLYCDREDKYGECARYRLRSQGELVPSVLLPNGSELAPRDPKNPKGPGQK